MPEHTLTQFRGKNRYGHNTTNSCKGCKKRLGSPVPKKIGNATKKICSFCNPELSNRLYSKSQLVIKINDLKKNNFVEYFG